MDFLVLLPHGKNIVIEIDGKLHYSENERASLRLYAKMVAEDRQLNLTGYKLYRFGGYKFLKAEEAQQTVKDFFKDLSKLYPISYGSNPTAPLQRTQGRCKDAESGESRMLSLRIPGRTMFAPKSECPSYDSSLR